VTSNQDLFYLNPLFLTSNLSRLSSSTLADLIEEETRIKTTPYQRDGSTRHVVDKKESVKGTVKEVMSRPLGMPRHMHAEMERQRVAERRIEESHQVIGGGMIMHEPLSASVQNKIRSNGIGSKAAAKSKGKALGLHQEHNQRRFNTKQEERVSTAQALTNKERVLREKKLQVEAERGQRENELAKAFTFTFVVTLILNPDRDRDRYPNLKVRKEAFYERLNYKQRYEGSSLVDVTGLINQAVSEKISGNSLSYTEENRENLLLSNTETGLESSKMEANAPCSLGSLVLKKEKEKKSRMVSRKNGLANGIRVLSLDNLNTSPFSVNHKSSDKSRTSPERVSHANTKEALIKNYAVANAVKRRCQPELRGKPLALGDEPEKEERRGRWNVDQGQSFKVEVRHVADDSAERNETPYKEVHGDFFSTPVPPKPRAPSPRVGASPRAPSPRATKASGLLTEMPEEVGLKPIVLPSEHMRPSSPLMRGAWGGKDVGGAKPVAGNGTSSLLKASLKQGKGLQIAPQQKLPLWAREAVGEAMLQWPLSTEESSGRNPEETEMRVAERGVGSREPSFVEGPCLNDLISMGEELQEQWKTLEGNTPQTGVNSPWRHTTSLKSPNKSNSNKEGSALSDPSASVKAIFSVSPLASSPRQETKKEDESRGSFSRSHLSPTAGTSSPSNGTAELYASPPPEVQKVQEVQQTPSAEVEARFAHAVEECNAILRPASFAFNVGSPCATNAAGSPRAFNVGSPCSVPSDAETSKAGVESSAIGVSADVFEAHMTRLIRERELRATRANAEAVTEVKKVDERASSEGLFEWGRRALEPPQTTGFETEVPMLAELARQEAPETAMAERECRDVTEVDKRLEMAERTDATAAVSDSAAVEMCPCDESLVDIDEFDAEWQEQPLPTLIDNGYALLEMLRDEASDTDSPLHRPMEEVTTPSQRDGAASTCAICLDSIKVQGARRQLQCGHIFHVKCITKWLQAKSQKGQATVCPLCRKSEPGRKIPKLKPTCIR